MEKKDNLEEIPSEESVLKWTDYFKKAWPMLRETLIKAALLKFLPRVISGPWGWLATVILNWSLDHVLKPLYDVSVRKILVLIKRKSNNQAGKDVQESKTEDDFNTSVDNLP